MESQRSTEHRLIARLGVTVGIVTAVVTAITFGIAVMTPPMSGPFCDGPCFEYPYTNIASRFPRDYLWMYPAMLVTILFVFLMACVHYHKSNQRGIFSHIGLSLSLISAVILIIDYFIQVTVIQPSVLSGETDGIALMTQYNPHGIFIALEEVGYLLMSVAFLAVAPVFSWRSRMGRALRLVIVVSFLLAFFSLVLVSLIYGVMREYIFEVIIISIAWLELIVVSILLAIFFKKEQNDFS